MKRGIFIFSLLIFQEQKEIPTGSLQYIEWANHDIDLLGIGEKHNCACEAANKFKPDIIILDLKAPPLSLLLLVNQLYLGNTDELNILIKKSTETEFAREMLTKRHMKRVSDYRPEIIVLLSGNEYENSRHVTNYGASACLMKPYTVGEMTRALSDAKAALSERKAGVFEPERILTKKNNIFNEIIKKTMKYVQDNYGRDIGLLEIASKFYLSPNYLCMLFKKETGISLNNYIQKIRVENAGRLLLNNDEPMPEIAWAVGFNDEKYFYGVFKKYMCITPCKYRKKYKSLNEKKVGWFSSNDGKYL